MQLTNICSSMAQIKRQMETSAPHILAKLKYLSNIYSPSQIFVGIQLPFWHLFRFFLLQNLKVTLRNPQALHTWAHPIPSKIPDWFPLVSCSSQGRCASWGSAPGVFSTMCFHHKRGIAGCVFVLGKYTVVEMLSPSECWWICSACQT